MKIDAVVSANLCISCGICQGICPAQCITETKKGGMYLPVIDTKKCIDCGLCYKLCPGKGCNYTEKYIQNGTELPSDIFLGNCKEALTMQSKNKDILGKSTSGGVISTLVEKMLGDGLYDSAFLIDTYSYEKELFTERYTYLSDMIGESRYVTVNQAKAVRYILQHRDEKIILVGVSCFIQGFIDIVNKLKLNRNNYFLIGLFCDKTMNYNVWDYFNKMCKIGLLTELHFRSKKAGGWPGNVLVKSSEKESEIPKWKRMEIKEYFCPERCLYCLDKLNQFADISVGDNYTEKNESKLGSSSVVIRSECALNIIDRYSEEFLIWNSALEEIACSQDLNNRRYNYFWSEQKANSIGGEINIIESKYIPDKRKYKEIDKRYMKLRKKQTI